MKRREKHRHTDKTSFVINTSLDFAQQHDPTIFPQTLRYEGKSCIDSITNAIGVCASIVVEVFMYLND